MPHAQLTDLAIRNIAPPSSGSIEIWDGKLPGFGVRVSPKGARSFVLLYRIDGRARRLTLGRHPVLSLSEARRIAQQALAQVTQGIDPAPEREASSHTENPLAFEIFALQFIERYARPKNKDWGESQRLLDREFTSHWRGRDIREIKRSDVLAVIDAIVARSSISLKVVLEGSSVQSLKEFTRQTDAVSFQYQVGTRRDVMRGELVAIPLVDRSLAQTRLTLAVRAGRMLPIASQSFASLLEQTLSRLASTSASNNAT